MLELTYSVGNIFQKVGQTRVVRIFCSAATVNEQTDARWGSWSLNRNDFKAVSQSGLTDFGSISEGAEVLGLLLVKIRIIVQILL